MMSMNFETKVKPLAAEIAQSGKSEKSIIIMASLIEREARGDDRATISGILWKRISLGRALEVDAAPETYKTKGLPASPIANPGLSSLRASVFPEKNPYWYFLTPPDGRVIYSKTFDEHVKNKRRFL